MALFHNLDEQTGKVLVVTLALLCCFAIGAVTERKKHHVRKLIESSLSWITRNLTLKEEAPPRAA
jgi:hypothetical protein